MTNRIILIGWRGGKTAYLNMSKEDAVLRHRRRHPTAPDDLTAFDEPVVEFTFDDEFGAFDAWGPPC